MDSLLTSFDKYTTDAFAITLIASGVVCCFLGYRLFRIVLGVTGFLGGAVLVWTLAVGGGYSQVVVLASALLVGLAGAIAMFSLFYVGVFLFGCSLGLLTSTVLSSAFGTEFGILLTSLFGLIAGLVTLLIRKGVMVTSTALTGSWAVLSGTSHFVDSVDLVRVFLEPNIPRSQDNLYYGILILWLLLGTSGLAVQLRWLRRIKNRKYR